MSSTRAPAAPASPSRGQYRPVPGNDHAAADHDDVDIEPTFWEKSRDVVTAYFRRLFIPILVFISVGIVVLLSILLIVRPKGTAPIGGGNGGSPVLIPPGGESGTWNAIRLPSHIVPIQYDLNFGTIVDGEFNSTFAGDAAIRLNFTKPSNFVAVHAVGLNLTNVALAVDANTTLVPVRHEVNTARQYHVFVFDRAVSTVATLRIHYAGKIDRSLRGYYLAKYIDTETGAPNWIATTQFEATDARRAFPCLDEPAMKATFEITMSTQSHLHALSNMHVVSRDIAIPNGVAVADKYALTKTYKFAPTPRMSSYLVAFIVSDFESTSATSKGGVTVSVWTQPGITSMGEYAARVGAAVLDYYEILLGIPFPMRFLALVSVPDFAAGAMENWARVATVIAHELAHQWFGDLVTMKWWDDLYLNEGFATFSEFLGTAAAEPSFGMPEQFYRMDQVKAMLADASPHSRAIHATVNDPVEIEGLFDAISYSKGGSILHMIQHFLEARGRSFFGGVHNYLEAHAYNNAESRDLWDALSFPDLNVTRIVQEWIQTPGYPRVTFSLPESTSAGKPVVPGRGPVPASLAVEQTRNSGIRVNASEPTNPLGTVWQIPLTWAVYTNRTGVPVATGAAQSTVFDAAKGAIQLTTPPARDLPVFDEHWVIKPNVGQHGFYRFVIPSPMLHTVAEWWTANPQLWTPLDRAGVLEDALDRLMAGDADVDAALGLLRGLYREQTYTVWGVAMDRLASIRRLLELHPDYAAVSSVLNGLVEKVVKNIGWDEETDEFEVEAKGGESQSRHVRALLRTEILSFAASIGHAPTVRKAQELFELLADEVELASIARSKHKPPRRPAVPVALVPVVLDTAVRAGGDREYAVVEQRLRSATLTNDEAVYLHALAQATAPHLIVRNVALALSSAVRGQDKVRFMSWIVRSAPTAPALVADYLDAHWATFLEQLGGGGAFSSATELIGVLAESAHNEAEMARVAALFDATKRAVPPNTKVALDTGLTRAREHAVWRERVGEQVVGWAKKEAAARMA
ncbi:Aminopeptidase 2 mitochondrial [Blastocladiella emersonii ATCC 22665]|nr:Aminopeptidase 2 mitochondrial [Blastocladiella emersonii ATCC 22665]